MVCIAGPVASDTTRILNVGPSRFGSEMVARVLELRSDWTVVANCYSASTASSLVGELAPDLLVVNSFLGSGSAWDIETNGLPMLLVVLSPPPRDVIESGGVSGYCTWDTSVDDFIDAVEIVAAGGTVFPGGLVELDDSVPVPELTAREREVLELLAQASTVTQIATRLHISVHTVRNHVRALRRKFGASSQLEIVVRAAQAGLTSGLFSARRLN